MQRYSTPKETHSDYETTTFLHDKWHNIPEPDEHVWDTTPRELALPDCRSGRRCEGSIAIQAKSSTPASFFSLPSSVFFP
jgi:hypothetical protein